MEGSFAGACMGSGSGIRIGIVTKRRSRAFGFVDRDSGAHGMHCMV